MTEISVIGLGYVGLPLLKELAYYYDVKGIDIDIAKTEVIQRALAIEQNIKNISIQNDLLTSSSNVYIVTVPTPVDEYYRPNLKPLINASRMIGKYLKKGDLVIYESTVYPGCTEEICVKELEEISNLQLNIDFEVGYSPERINPGDLTHSLSNTVKIVSASSKDALKKVSNIYSKIIKAGLYEAASIRVAEAAKVIENTQRDLNISFMNELALMFDKMGIDTNEVIDAASTKWNFLPFRPGLVGGHCISVDPYYLTFKAQQLGYTPEVILSGRRINNEMPRFVVNKVVKLLAQRNYSIQKSKILILGFAFKENCEDFRNTRVADMYTEFLEFGANVEIFDPLVDINQVTKFYNVNIKSTIDSNTKFDAIVLAVAHSEFKGLRIDKLKKEKDSIIFDTKNFYPKDKVSGRL